MKEPLRKIEIFIKLIKDNFIKDEPKAVDYINRTVNASERMNKLITDLLEYSRLSSKVVPEKTNLNQVLEEVISDFDYLIEEKTLL